MSMCLDKAPHIADNFCEVPMLSESDFEGLEGSRKEGKISHDALLFFVHHSRLTLQGKRLSKMRVYSSSLLTAYQVNRPHPWGLAQVKDHEDEPRKDLLHRISRWSSSLPSELRPSKSLNTWAMLTLMITELVSIQKIIVTLR